ncbi:MAG: hypothetical protein HUU29_10250 [Planctomycetaceae bacterium]|nr:hypothetical protein [Planctomycetaceae bacterium]
MAALGWWAGSFFDFWGDELPELKDQATADVTHSIVILAAYPGGHPTAIPGAELPEDKRWLPRVVTSIGSDLTDRNRALESESNRAADLMLPRCRFPLEVGGMSTILTGSGARHVIVVEFTPGGGGWRVLGARFDPGDKAYSTPVERQWPANDAARTLTRDIAAVAQILSGYRIHTDKVFDVSDDIAMRYAAFMESLRNKNVMVMDEQLAELQKDAPDFELPLYYRWQAYIDTSQRDLINEVFRVVDDYRKRGGNHPRILNLYARAAAMSRSNMEEGYTIAKQLVDQDRLNMAAYNQLRELEPEYLRSIGQKAPTTEVRDRESVRLYPRDGRYHIALASNLMLSLYGGDEAVRVAQEGADLCPWSNTALYQVGRAMLQQAMGHSRDWPKEQLARQFHNAAIVIERAWLANPNITDYVLEHWLQALTHEYKVLPESKADAGTAFQLALILSDLISARGASKVLELYDERQRAVLTADLESLLAANQLARDADLLLLSGISLRHMQYQASSTDEEKARSRQFLADVLKRYYVELGGRCSEAVALYNEFAKGK